MSTREWAEIEKLTRTIQRRLRDEENGLADDVDAGVFDALVEALGFDNGIEVCILWWCPNTRRSGYWCHLHDRGYTNFKGHRVWGWPDLYREVRKATGTWGKKL